METLTIEEVDIDEFLDEPSKLIVYNDDHNTFDHVIDSLMKVCKLSLEDAIQRTHEVHNRGKSLVNSGTFKEMKKQQSLLSSMDITCDVEME